MLVTLFVASFASSTDNGVTKSGTSVVVAVAVVVVVVVVVEFVVFIGVCNAETGKAIIVGDFLTTDDEEETRCATETKKNASKQISHDFYIYVILYNW